MDSTTIWIIAGSILVGAVIGAVVYYRKKTKEMHEMFKHVQETVKQVPKQKKQSFILFMFKESVRAAKSKTTVNQGRFNDPRILEAQLIQMSGILKDRSKVSDKKMKQALQMYDSYTNWEKKIS
jgi:translation elongation factor EF-Tu-like GTPase